MHIITIKHFKVIQDRIIAIFIIINFFLHIFFFKLQTKLLQFKQTNKQNKQKKKHHKNAKYD